MHIEKKFANVKQILLDNKEITKLTSEVFGMQVPSEFTFGKSRLLERLIKSASVYTH